MSKAKELAEIKYPIHSVRIVPARGGGYYADKHLREGFINGYHQAEKDLTDKARLSSGWDGFYYGQGYHQAKKDLKLTWEDIELIETISKAFIKNNTTPMSDRDYYQEILKQFNEKRKK